MKRLTATVTGRVQGVYFRAYTEQTARQLGLTGWVANCADGSVKVVVEGEEAVLQQMLQWLHRGPPLAHVDGVDEIWSVASGEFNRFAITH